MSKELDVEIEEVRGWASDVDSLARSDASGSITRLEISKIMAYAVCIAIYAFVLCWLIAILLDSWPAIVAIMGEPALLLLAYFGMKKKEKKERYDLASGQPAPLGGFDGLGGLIKALAGRG